MDVGRCVDSLDDNAAASGPERLLGFRIEHLCEFSWDPMGEDRLFEEQLVGPAPAGVPAGLRWNNNSRTPGVHATFALTFHVTIFRERPLWAYGSLGSLWNAWRRCPPGRGACGRADEPA